MSNYRLHTIGNIMKMVLEEYNGNQPDNEETLLLLFGKQLEDEYTLSSLLLQHQGRYSLICLTLSDFHPSKTECFDYHVTIRKEGKGDTNTTWSEEYHNKMDTSCDRILQKNPTTTTRNWRHWRVERTGSWSYCSMFNLYQMKDIASTYRIQQGTSLLFQM